jgi:catechol 2,3-dioxygenase-like lactoylglutathione lyase family enzyme
MTAHTELGHIALIVHDPARTAALLEAVFDAKGIRRRDAEGHDEVNIRVGNVWFVLVAADVERALTGDHVAFHVDPDALHGFAARLQRMGHEYQMARADTALYFKDFDNHLFEIECSGLDAELTRESA